MSGRFPSLWCFLLVILGLSALPCAPARAAESEPKREKPADAAQSHYNAGLELVEQGRHAAARVEFEKALELKGEDPDILNMLAFTLRKTGELERAFELYERALTARERFPQAREYLGEAHIQAALHQIRILRGYGAEGQEELEVLLDALRRAANLAAGTDFEVEPANW